MQHRVREGSSRRRRAVVVWVAVGAVLGFVLGMLAALTFDGVGPLAGAGIGLALAAALGFAGFLYATDRGARR